MFDYFLLILIYRCTCRIVVVCESEMWIQEHSLYSLSSSIRSGIDFTRAGIPSMSLSMTVRLDPLFQTQIPRLWLLPSNDSDLHLNEHGEVEDSDFYEASLELPGKLNSLGSSYHSLPSGGCSSNEDDGSTIIKDTIHKLEGKKAGLRPLVRGSAHLYLISNIRIRKRSFSLNITFCNAFADTRSKG